MVVMVKEAKRHDDEVDYGKQQLALTAINECDGTYCDDGILCKL